MAQAAERLGIAVSKFLRRNYPVRSEQVTVQV